MPEVPPQGQSSGDDNPQVAAFKAIMERFKITPADWARAAGFNHPTQLYNLLHGRTKRLSVDVLQKFASVFPGLTVDALSGTASIPEGLAQAGDALESFRTRTAVLRRKIRLVAALGVWHSSPLQEVILGEGLEPDLPADSPNRFNVQVRGDHAMPVVSDGGVITVEDITSFRGALRSGQVVLVEHQITEPETLVEHTFRRLLQKANNWGITILNKDIRVQKPEVQMPKNGLAAPIHQAL
jgi:hypothetical protein